MLPTDDNDWIEDLRVDLSEREVADLGETVGETLVFTGSKTAAAAWLVIPGTLAYVLGALLVGTIWTSWWRLLAYFVVLPALWWTLRLISGRLFGSAIRWQAVNLFFFAYLMGFGAFIAAGSQSRWWAYGVSAASGFFVGMIYGSLDPAAIRNKEAWMVSLPLALLSSLLATYLHRHLVGLTAIQIDAVAAAIGGLLFTVPMMVLLMRLWENSRGLRHLGLLYLHHPSFLNKSIGCFAKALELDPDNVELLNLRGVAWSRLGDRSRAETDWARALEVDPNNAETVRHQSDALIRDGAIEEALLSLDQAVKVHPTHAPLHASLAIALVARHNDATAMEHFSRAIELEPRRPSTYAWRARIHLADGALNKVIDDCSHAIEINREFAMPLLLRGQAYARIGELEKAEEDFRDALDAAPNEEVAKEARRRLTALSQEH